MGIPSSEAAQLAFERVEKLALDDRGYCEVHLLLVEWSRLPQLKCAIPRALNDGPTWPGRSQVINDIEQSKRGVLTERHSVGFEPSALRVAAQSHAQKARAAELRESHLCRGLVDLARQELNSLGVRVDQLIDFVEVTEVPANLAWPQAEPREPMEVRPLFQGRALKTDMDLAFVVMPFRPDWADRVWAVIAGACEERRLRALRADHMHGAVINEDIWRGILQARLVIVDVTEKNPNVFYELGIVHTVGKDCVLLSQSTEDLPFDTRALRHIAYQPDAAGLDSLRAALDDRLAHLLASAS